LCRSQRQSNRAAKKGQLFFVAAIFMILGFVLLRGVMTLPAITQEKAFQDVSYLDRNLKNIRAEYERTAAVASLKPFGTGAGYLYNFSEQVRGDFDGTILYVFAAANGTENFSLTLGNFMQGNVSGTMAFTGATPPSVSFQLGDRTNTTYTLSGTGWVSVTLNYTLNSPVGEKFYLDTSRNYAAGFFDISLRSKGMMVRSKSYYNRTW
jgi:hypothetical protein